MATDTPMEHLTQQGHEQAHHPLSYPGEERHDVREQTETTLRQSFEDRAQALIERIQGLGHAVERGQEMG